MKKRRLRIAIAQIDPTVGDLKGNAERISGFVRSAKVAQADIVVFPELALTGYPPEDLLLKPQFVEDNLAALGRLAGSIADITAIVGFVDRDKAGLYNAAAVIASGAIRAVCHKMFLPNYSVFDEKRYFLPGRKPCLFRYNDCLVGLDICEDIWEPAGPVAKQVPAGANLILTINASPYYAGKVALREKIVTKIASCNKVPVVYANLVGGQDELVFDGQSMICDAKGAIKLRGQAFKEDLLIADIEVALSGEKARSRIPEVKAAAGSKEKIPLLAKKEIKALREAEEVYQALVLGLRDYAQKNGFSKAVIGLSGGVDSSLVACIAVDALGRENVTGIFLPSRHSSHESEVDARQLALNLRIDLKVLSIEQIYKVYLLLLEPHFAGLPKDLAEENVQARIRGTVIMAFSNKFNWLVLTTGNKSEISTGYATLYGDMAGGFAVIKDVAKTMVYELARYRNGKEEPIPPRVLTKAPTAELRPNQKDTDSLGPYEILDPIVKAYVEEDKSVDEIVRGGFAEEAVRRTVSLVDRSEYKRRQAPPGVKITPRAFGKDRRMPITNKYRR